MELETKPHRQSRITAAYAGWLPRSLWIEPIYEIEPNNDETLWEPCVDGFTRAMALRPKAWEGLLERADEETGETMIFIMALEDIYTGNSKFTDEEIDVIDLEAPDLIPNCITGILRHARPELAGLMPSNLPGQPFKAEPRPRRNDPCLYGLGRNYKQCCDKN